MEAVEIISQYSRANAIEDGVLIDVSKMAREAGFKVHVAITSELNSKLKDIPPEFYWQDYNGRLWDLLNMAVFNGRKQPVSKLIYEFICPHTVQTLEDGIIVKNDMRIQMEAHAGDDFECVITLKLI